MLIVVGAFSLSWVNLMVPVAWEVPFNTQTALTIFLMRKKGQQRGSLSAEIGSGSIEFRTRSKSRIGLRILPGGTLSRITTVRKHQFS